MSEDCAVKSAYLLSESNGERFYRTKVTLDPLSYLPRHGFLLKIGSDWHIIRGSWCKYCGYIISDGMYLLLYFQGEDIYISSRSETQKYLVSM